MPSPTHKQDELMKKRANLVSQARELVERADAEKRNLEADEKEQYDRIMADVDALKEAADREHRLTSVEKELEGATRKAPTPDMSDAASVDPKGSEYRQALFTYFRQGINGIGPNEFRALEVGQNSEGGYTVDTEFEKQIIDFLVEENVMRSLCTVVQTSSNRNIPIVSSSGVAEWVEEEGNVPTTHDPAFGQKQLKAYKLSDIIKASEELLMDSEFDLASFLAGQFARKFGLAEEEAFINGDGNGKPTGFLASSEEGTSGGALTGDALITLFHSLVRGYRQRASFLMADGTAANVRSLREGTGDEVGGASRGNYLWQPGLQAGQPDLLLGRPVFTSPGMPADASGNKTVAFGDFNFVWIGDRGGRTFQRLNELYAANGQVGFKATQRVDAVLTQPSAVKHYSRTS